MTTFVLSVFNAKLVGNAKLEAVVLPIALFYGGIAQLLAGMWEFRKNNTFGAAGLHQLRGLLAVVRRLRQVRRPRPARRGCEHRHRDLLGAWTIFTFSMWIASLRTTGAVAAVFTVLLVTFTLLTFGAFNPDTSLSEWGGYFGIATAALAWYASAAAVLNSTWGRVLLPNFPLKK